MTTEEFQELLLRYKQGNCSAEEVRKIENWFSELNSVSEVSVSDEEKELLEKAIWQVVRGNMAAAKKRNSRPDGSWRLYSAMAAAVLLVIALVAGMYLQQAPGYLDKPVTLLRALLPGQQGWVIRENRTDGVTLVELEDGSKITLLPHSSVSYPKALNPDKREVRLQGDAFFEIARQEGRPFFVYHGKLVTHVLGTSFWIKRDPAANSLHVEVVTGKVSVYEQDEAAPLSPEGIEKKTIILTPNQRVTYNEQSGDLVTEVMQEANLTSPPEKADAYSLHFNNASLPEIKTVLEKNFGTEVILLNEEMNVCTFTGDVDGLAIAEMMDLISKSIGTITYEIKGRCVLLYGDGCD